MWESQGSQHLYARMLVDAPQWAAEHDTINAIQVSHLLVDVPIPLQENFGDA